MNGRFVYTLTGVLGISLLANLAPSSELLPEPVAELAIADAQAQSAMTVERLGDILQDEAGDLQGSAGQWQLSVEGQTVIVLADTANNRMRIMTPIGAAETLSVDQVEAILVANFHSALDARYAVTNGTLVAVYVHPLASLQADDFRSALQQVTTLAATFGTTYTSGELGFGPAAGPANERKVPEGLIDI
ncbi:MAG: hypothetical protein F6K00_14565 [Leptolyngbya sp. SIOISBB]|nr:hypothetical protein [Leptolyngbya sp. SIOISBB]